jgi:vesicle coat complex subunit
LQHVNSSVSLEAVKVLMIILEYNYSGDLNSNIVKKLAPPLITLLSSEPEIQYVALRNINLILQKRPDILSQEVRLFFTKYNDPAYVKLEKLEVIIKLANESNIAQVVSELKEYANEVDVEFVRRSVRAIGRCAIKIPAAADLCVETLLDLIKTGVAYIIQESIVITRDIFRKYPNRYEGIIQTLCDHLESIDEPEAKAALIWVIAEYAERIEGAVSLLEYFLQDFKDQVPRVQLQLLTSAVKIFLKKPAQCQEIVQKLLTETANTMENPDIRDRAIVYWRLLSTNPESAKRVVLAEKPPIEFTTSAVSESLMNELLFHLGSLASVFHKSPSLVGTSAYVDMAAFKEGVDYEDDLDRKVEFTRAAKALGGPIIENLLDLDTEILSPTVDYSPSNTKQVVDDLLSLDLGPSPNLEVFLTAAAAQGFELSGSFSKRQGLFLDLVFSNKSSNAMSEFAIQFNVNR